MWDSVIPRTGSCRPPAGTGVPRLSELSGPRVERSLSAPGVTPCEAQVWA
jgi:hypothetical protein